MNVVLVSLYETFSFPLRILSPLLNDLEGIQAYCVFFKNKYGNKLKLQTKQEEQLFIDTIKELNPGIVGFSVYTAFSPIAARLNQLVKENSDALTIWGGCHPTLYPDMCIDKTDTICVGEGEETLVELVQAVAESRPWRDIRNLWVNRNGEIIKNPLRPLNQDIDARHFPSYGNPNFIFIEDNKVTRQDPLIDMPCLWVQTAQGCPYKCSFCINGLLHDKYRGLGKFLRRRSVDNILREIKTYMEKYGENVQSIFFFDEVFATNPEWLQEFKERYKKEVGLPFACSLNPLMVKQNIISELAEAGLREITVGIQSGSDEIRNEIFERKGSGDEIVHVAKKIKELNLLAVYDLILDNPYDDEETLEGTLRLMLRLPKPLSFHLYRLQFFPEFAVTQKALRDSKIMPEHATPEYLLRSVGENWAFFPTLFPYERKRILENIIWLYARNKCSDKTVENIIARKPFASSAALFFTNIKAVILGQLSLHLIYNSRFFGNLIGVVRAKITPSRILKKFN